MRFSWLFTFLPAISATYYYWKGAIARGYVPCSVTAGGNSVSCGNGFVCLSNKICMSILTESDATGGSAYVCGSCTEQTWNSVKCPEFCVNSTVGVLLIPRIIDRTESLTKRAR